jgi:hypothetical protein
MGVHKKNCTNSLKVIVVTTPIKPKIVRPNAVINLKMVNKKYQTITLWQG